MRRPDLEKEGSVPTWLVDHPLLLQGQRDLEARDLHWTKYRVLFKHHLLTTDDFMLCTPALNSMGTAPWVRVLAAVREAALAGTSGVLVLSPLCLLAVYSTGGS